jgi:Family of unknown function (DUF5681)
MTVSAKKPPLGDEPHDGEEQYEVGYRKPPQRTRFRPGESGNPKGRPKGVNNLATDVKNALAQKIPVRSEGKSRLVSTQQAGIMVLREKALKGDPRALNRLLDLAARFNNELVQGTGSEPTADEQEIIRAWEEDILGTSAKGGS